MLLNDIIVRDFVYSQDVVLEYTCSEENILTDCEKYKIYSIENFSSNLYQKGIEEIFLEDDDAQIQLALCSVNSLLDNKIRIQVSIQEKNMEQGIFNVSLYKIKNKGYVELDCIMLPFYDFMQHYISKYMVPHLSNILINIGLKYFIKYDGEIKSISKDYPYIYVIDKIIELCGNKIDKKEEEESSKITKLKNQYESELNEYNKLKEAGYTFKKIKNLDKLKEKQERRICELEEENKRLRLKLKEKSPLNSTFENEFRKEIQDYKNDIMFLEEENERCYGELSNLNNELNRLRELYVKLSNSREEQLKKYKHITEWINLLKEESDSIIDIGKEIEGDFAAFSPDNNVSESDLDIFLKSKKIIVSGGHVNWQNKIKEKYPWFTYIDVDNVNFDVNILKTADYIFFNTLHCSHTLYFKFKNNMNVGRNKQDVKDKLIYINNNSLDYFINALEKLLVE